MQNINRYGKTEILQRIVRRKQIVEELGVNQENMQGNGSKKDAKQTG
jgi:hypothetical protein